MQASEVAYLFGLDGKPIRAVNDVSEWTVDERIDSTNRLIVDTSLAEARDIVSDMELVFNGRRYVVTQVDRARGDGIAELTGRVAMVSRNLPLMSVSLKWLTSSWRLTSAKTYASSML